VADDDRLARMFRQYAEYEFRGASPVYERLSLALADAPGVAAPLRAAPVPQRRALLLFAATQYLLRTRAAGHPLAAYLPSHGGDRPVDDALWPVFVDFATTWSAELAALCATRTTQTNEACRAAVRRPGLGRAARLAGGRPVALIELGTSAGLLLLPDRYAYRYVHPATGRHERHGRPDAPPALVVDCAVRGDGWPEVASTVSIASRIGIDLSPVDPADADAVTWLRSCVWPEQADRLARLDAALDEARRVRPRLVRGDLVAALPAILSTVDEETLPVVFASNALTYLPGAALAVLVGVLAETGAARDLAVVVNEGASCGVRLFSAAAPDGPPACTTLAAVTWRAGRPRVDLLGSAAPHATWLSWSPRQYPYRPVAVPAAGRVAATVDASDGCE
jgi:hypothetical protein